LTRSPTRTTDIQAIKAAIRSAEFSEAADSLSPHFPATKPAAPFANQLHHPARKEPRMQRRLRRSIPFLLAIFFGMIAGILVAGVAILAAHP